MTDSELLARFIEGRDADAAFAELVGRRLDLVYSAALRQAAMLDSTRDGFAEFLPQFDLTPEQTNLWLVAFSENGRAAFQGIQNAAQAGVTPATDLALFEGFRDAAMADAQGWIRELLGEGDYQKFLEWSEQRAPAIGGTANFLARLKPALEAAGVGLTPGQTAQLRRTLIESAPLDNRIGEVPLKHLIALPLQPGVVERAGAFLSPAQLAVLSDLGRSLQGYLDQSERAARARRTAIDRADPVPANP